MDFSSHLALAGLDLDDFLAAVRPKLRSMLAAFNVPIQDAEDVVQNALVTLVEDDVEGVDTLEGWLLGILKRKILQYWDSRTRHDRALALLERDAATSQPADQERLDCLFDLLALTAHLSPRSVRALWLRYGLGRRPREIAKVLHCLPDSVRKLTHRALAQAQRQLAAVTRMESERRRLASTAVASLLAPASPLRDARPGAPANRRSVERAALVALVERASGPHGTPRRSLRSHHRTGRARPTTEGKHSQ